MEEAPWTSWRPELVAIRKHPLQDESGRFAEPLAVRHPLSVYSVEQLEAATTQGLCAYISFCPDDDTGKVLCAFWDHLPDSGRVTLMAEIVYLSCRPHAIKRLRQLRDFLVDAIINPLTAAGVQNGPLLNENGHECWDKTVPQEPRYDWTRGAMALREKTLTRDGNRCVLSGMTDVGRYVKMNRHDRRNLSAGMTRCAYILPFALSHAETPSRTEGLNTTWRALYRYFPYLQDRIGWHTICTPVNTITLSGHEYWEFVAFKGVLEPDSTEKHTYHCHNFSLRMPSSMTMKTYLSSPETVVLKNHSDDETQMPDSLFLLTHCRLARILRATRLGYKHPDGY